MGRSLKELSGNDGAKDITIDKVGLEVRREKNRHKGKEDITVE